MKTKISLYVLVIFYLVAGFNHFISPASYISIIPAYLGNASQINIAAGLSEILLAILLAFHSTRRLASFGIILMLVAFLPVHVYMLHDHICLGKFCPSDLILWARLFVLQPLLIGWAWKTGKYSTQKKHLKKML
ncbi:MAG: hypothetical protein ABIY51_12360 [Ferruginibacter sp.]